MNFIRLAAMNIRRVILFFISIALILPFFILPSGAGEGIAPRSAHIRAEGEGRFLKDSPYNHSQEVQLFGLKGFIVKKSLKGISWLVREAPEVFVDKAGDALDDSARRAVLKNSGAIADKIDEVAELPDLTHHVVKEKLNYALEPIVGTSLSLVIADVIAWLAL